MTIATSAPEAHPVDYTYALLDCAAHDDAFAQLNAAFPTACWQSLFDGTPEAHLHSAAPLLIALDLAAGDNTIIAWLIEKERQQPSVTWIKSRYALPTLAMMLARRLQCRINDDEEVVLRFYDPRILLGLSAALTVAQKKFFFAPVTSWTAWEARRQTYYGIDPEPATPADVAAFSAALINLNDRQREQLMYYDKEVLYDSIVAHWESNSPDAIEGLAPDVLREVAIVAVTRCASYGIHGADDQHLFAGLMMRVSPSFDAHPMVRSYLRDETLAPEDRLSKMIDELPDVIWRQIDGEKRYEALFESTLSA
jgi:hypothetical protein